MTPRPLCGGITFPCEIGAVVDGLSSDFHTPLSGHFSPVRAVVPMGFFMMIILKNYGIIRIYRTKMDVQ